MFYNILLIRHFYGVEHLHVTFLNMLLNVLCLLGIGIGGNPEPALIERVKGNTSNNQPCPVYIQNVMSSSLFRFHKVGVFRTRRVGE